MKRFIAGILAVVLCLGMVGCGSNENEITSESSISSSELTASIDESSMAQTKVNIWTQDDFYIYDENGVLQYLAQDMRLSDLNKKSGKNLQMKAGIRIGSTAKELVEKLDVSKFYSGATPIGNSILDIPESQQKDIDSFENEYKGTMERLDNIDKLVELDLGLCLTHYFYIDNGTVFSCKTNENGRQADYEETKQFDRYDISFQIDKGVVSDITIRNWDAQETNIDKINEFYGLLEPVMKEIGEKEELTNFILYKAKKVSEDESEDLGEYAKGTARGSKGIEATFISNSKGEWRVQSVSSIGDAFHYYYYPNAQEVMKYSPIAIKLYDYSTDVEIPLSSLDDLDSQSDAISDRIHKSTIETMCDQVRQGTTYELLDDGTVKFILPIEGEVTEENVQEAYDAVDDYAPSFALIYKLTEYEKFIFSIRDSSDALILDIKMDCSGEEIEVTGTVNPDYYDIVKPIVE